MGPTLPDLALLPDPALVTDGDRVAAASPSAESLFRRPLAAGTPVEDIVPSLGAGRCVGRRADGTPFAVDASIGALGDGRRLVLLRELDERRLLGEAQRCFDVAFDHSPIGMALFNTDGEYVRVNDALCALLGRPRTELLGMRDNALTHPDDRAADVDGAWQVLRGERSTWQVEKRFVRPSGDVVWCLASLVFLRDEDGRPLTWVGQFVDVTERHAAEHALRRQAECDPLTELLNRRGFDAALAACGDGAVVVVDIDHFKAVNDVHGHAAGDEVLRAVAGVLRARLRRSDAVARLGGDEFAVLLPGCDADEAGELASDLVTRIGALVSLPCRVSGSAGAATGRSGTALLHAADRALYAAKAAGRGRAHLAA